MERFIKYKRIVKEFYDDENKVQSFFDSLITEGWEIIYYNEDIYNSSTPEANPRITITTVVGKKQNNIL